MRRTNGIGWSSLLVLLIIAIFPVSCGIAKNKEEFFKKGVAAYEKGDYNTALIELKNAVDKDPNYFEARYHLGLVYLKTGKFESAERELKKVLKLNPSFKEALLPLARALHAQNKLDEAFQTIAKGLQERPEDLEVLEVAAAVRASRKEFDEAHDLLRRAFALEPNKASTYRVLAQLYMMQNVPQEAEKAFAEALRLEPDDVSTLQALAHLEQAEGDYAAAKTHYNQILRIAPGALRALSGKGFIEFLNKDYDKAGILAGQMIKRYPNQPEGYYLRGMIRLQEGNPREAIPDFQRTLKHAPNHPGANLYLGQALFQTGDDEQAITALIKATEGSQQIFQPHLLLSLIYQKKGRAKEAVAEAERAAELSPELPLVHHVLGNAYMMSKNYDRALEEFEKTTDEDPKFIESYLKKGEFYLGSGNATRAEEEFLAALKLQPESVKIRALLAVFYIRQKEFADAIKTCNEGITEDSASNALFHNLLGIAYLGIQQEDTAINHFKKALSIAPGFSAPYANMARYYERKGQYDLALQQYEALVQADPKSPAGHILGGMFLERVGRDKEARQWFNDAKETGREEGYLALGQYLLRQGQSAEAGRVGDDLLTRWPDDPKVRDFRAIVFFEQKQPAKAREEYNALLKNNPEFLQAYLKLSGLYATEGAYEPALKELNTALSKAPGNVLILSQIVALHIKNHNTDQAIDAAERITRERPQSGLGEYYKGLAYVGSGNREEAVKWLLKARKLAPENIQLLAVLGELYKDMSRYDDAVNVYKDILRIKPDVASAYYNLGVIKELAGDAEEAMGNYRKALAISPGDVPSMNNLAYLLADGGRNVDEAVQLAEKAYNLSNQHASIADTLGWAYFKVGNVGAAIPYAEKAASAMTDNPSVQYHYARILLKNGQKDRAKKIFQNALEAPSFPERKEVEKLLETL